jgi:ABC-type amino acid transport substrate-binding protein
VGRYHPGKPWRKAGNVERSDVDGTLSLGGILLNTTFVGAIGLLFISASSACAQNPAQDSAQDQNADLQDLQVRLAPHKGDTDEMDKRRVVRALVSFNKTGLFFDNGRPRGMSYDPLMDFQKFLNNKLHSNDRTGKDKVNVVLVPTTYAKVSADLLNGNGDIIAIPVYITDERKKLTDFVPVLTSPHDVIVARRDARLVLLSVTEGEDKPLKYPTSFNSADCRDNHQNGLSRSRRIRRRHGPPQHSSRPSTACT